MGINIWAVLAAAVLSMIIGAVWYGPLFGTLFMRAMGWEHQTEAQKKQMQKGMAWSYAGQFVASLVTFYVLARFMNATGQITVAGAMVVAFWAWLGFIVPLSFGNALWGGKMTLFWLNIANMFVTLLAGAAILGWWR